MTGLTRFTDTYHLYRKQGYSHKLALSFARQHSDRDGDALETTHDGQTTGRWH